MDFKEQVSQQLADMQEMFKSQYPSVLGHVIEARRWLRSVEAFDSKCGQMLSMYLDTINKEIESVDAERVKTMTVLAADLVAIVGEPPSKKKPRMSPSPDRIKKKAKLGDQSEFCPQQKHKVY
jgi:hypothetical protein